MRTEVNFCKKRHNFSEMAGPVVLVTSASGRIGKEVIARLKSLGRSVDVITHCFSLTIFFRPGSLCALPCTTLRKATT